MSTVQPGNTRFIQEAMWGKTGQRIVFWPDVDGKLETATSVTVEIYKPGASTATVAATSVTAGGDGSCVYSLDASDTGVWGLMQDYMALWQFTANTVVYRRPQHFDVVRFPLLPFIPLRVDDLKAFDSRIDALLSQASITDAHQRWIQPAWWDILSRIRASGRRPALVADATVLYPVTRLRALWYLCLGVSEDSGDRYKELATFLLDEYERQWVLTRLIYREADSLANSAPLARVQPELGAGPFMGLGGVWQRHRLPPMRRGGG